MPTAALAGRPVTHDPSISGGSRGGATTIYDLRSTGFSSRAARFDRNDGWPDPKARSRGPGFESYDPNLRCQRRQQTRSPQGWVRPGGRIGGAKRQLSEPNKHQGVAGFPDLGPGVYNIPSTFAAAASRDGGSVSFTNAGRSKDLTADAKNFLTLPLGLGDRTVGPAYYSPPRGIGFTGMRPSTAISASHVRGVSPKFGGSVKRVRALSPVGSVLSPMPRTSPHGSSHGSGAAFQQSQTSAIRHSPVQVAYNQGDELRQGVFSARGFRSYTAKDVPETREERRQAIRAVRNLF